jgi:hypothetical protein
MTIQLSWEHATILRDCVLESQISRPLSEDEEEAFTFLNMQIALTESREFDECIRGLDHILDIN